MATKQAAKTEEKKGGFGKYFRGVKSEFKKVVWPTKKQIIQYSLIVIAASIACALLLSLYDRLLVFLLKPIYW